MQNRFKQLERQWPYIGFSLFSSIFIILICIHWGIFERNVIAVQSILQPLAAQETWMNIFHQDQKIGYSQRMIQPQENMYVLSDKTFLQLNTLGTLHDLHLKTSAILNTDMSVAQFSFDLNSDPFKFNVQGMIEGKKLRLIIGDTETQMVIPEKIYIPTALMDAAYALNLKPGEWRNIKLFDPSTMAMRTVIIFYDGQERLNLLGETLLCKVYSMEYMGMKSTAWINADGQIVQEKGIMGMTLQKTTKDQALRGLSGEKTSDLIAFSSVKTNILLNNPDRLSMITYEINGPFDIKNYAVGRQSQIAPNMMSIQREKIPSPPYYTTGVEQFLQTTPFIPSDHFLIRNQLKKIVRDADPVLVKIKKVMVWINDNIVKKPVISVPDAIETLKHRRGDCNEHAVLVAALLHACNIPTKIAAGLVYLDGRFYYHAWNEVYLNDWISLDVIMNQFPADVTHIRLVSGSPDKQMSLLGIIGNIKIKIIEKKP